MGLFYLCNFVDSLLVSCYSLFMTLTQYTDAILIVRIEKDGTRRVVGSAHAQSVADRTCIMLTREFYNYNTGRTYVTERNPKYIFDDANRVVGVR